MPGLRHGDATSGGEPGLAKIGWVAKPEVDIMIHTQLRRKAQEVYNNITKNSCLPPLLSGLRQKLQKLHWGHFTPTPRCRDKG